MTPSLLALVLLFPLISARLLDLPADTYAYPKYRVSFLNSLPLRNETAQRWLQDGLPGGEPEFLDRPWSGDERIAMEIDSGDSQAHVSAPCRPC
jgi:protein OS-9